MHVRSLRDDLFLLAHDDDGKLIGNHSSIEAGLAGAVLIDLLITGRVAVVDGRLGVIEGAPTADPELDATLEAIAASAEPCGPRAWVNWIAPGAYERTGELLAAAGVVEHSITRRLGLVNVHRYLPTTPDDLVRVRARLRYAVHGRDPTDPATAALCGLVRVVRLESALLLSMPTSDLLLGLERMTEASDVTVRQVTHAVDAVISNSTYR
jgi:Golgi phosphoprotein 3 GPP34